jgi:hypothetical protein
VRSCVRRSRSEEESRSNACNLEFHRLALPWVMLVAELGSSADDDGRREGDERYVPQEVERPVDGENDHRGDASGGRVHSRVGSGLPDRERDGRQPGGEKEKTGNTCLVKRLEILVVGVRDVHRRRSRCRDVPTEINASGPDARDRMIVRDPQGGMDLVRAIRRIDRDAVLAQLRQRVVLVGSRS